MRNTLLAAVTLSLVTLFATPSMADSVEISAECHWYVGVECQAQCEDLSFEGYCAGEVEVECDPHCDEFDVSASCEAGCQVDCEASCEASPAEASTASNITSNYHANISTPAEFIMSHTTN